MPLTLRRLLNRLPIPHGSRGEVYIRSSWHKPTQFDPMRSQAPFRPRLAALRSDHFGRTLRRQRFVRGLVRGTLVLATAWIVWESIRALA